MSGAVMCSWCHQMNPVGQEACSGCGHDAQRARMDCRCPACRAAGGRSFFFPTDIADKLLRDSMAQDLKRWTGQ